MGNLNECIDYIKNGVLVSKSLIFPLMIEILGIFCAFGRLSKLTVFIIVLYSGNSDNYWLNLTVFAE
jgi:hypothetical protein